MNTKSRSNKAVIYCRVSTGRQVQEGSSLSSQEEICNSYAQKHGYEVVQTFIEKGESAKTASRTELQTLLKYCESRKNDIGVVIFFKIDRWSRYTSDYHFIKAGLTKYSILVKSATEDFDETPAGKFMENMIISAAQYDNDVRTERSVGGMQFSVREGRYVWKAPIGYDNVRIAGKATIAPDNMAPFVRKSFELVSKNTYPVEGVRMMMVKEGMRLKSNKSVSKQYFYELLKNPLYAGIIEKLGETHKGKFEAIVSEDLFNRVQRILNNRSRKMSIYKRDNADFPLRRFVMHPSGAKLTGSWSTGYSRKYAFYRFRNIPNANFNRDAFTKWFVSYMNRYRLCQSQIAAFEELVKNKFGKARHKLEKETKALQKRLEELQQQEDLLIEKSLKNVLSDEILKQQLKRIEEERNKIDDLVYGDFVNTLQMKEMSSYMKEYLKNPGTVWLKSDLGTQLSLQQFHFPKGITFDGEKFGTEEISFVFKAKDLFSGRKSTNVAPGNELWNDLVKEILKLNNIIEPKS